MLALLMSLQSALSAFCFPVSCYPGIAEGKMQTSSMIQEYFVQIKALQGQLNDLYAQQKQLLIDRNATLSKIQTFEILNNEMLQKTVFHQEKLLKSKSVEKELK